jgi:hypothetical protein
LITSALEKHVVDVEAPEALRDAVCDVICEAVRLKQEGGA